MITSLCILENRTDSVLLKTKKVKHFTLTCEGQVALASSSLQYQELAVNQFLSCEKSVKSVIKKVIFLSQVFV